MSMNAAFYEFPVNRQNLQAIVDDLGMEQPRVHIIGMVDNLLSLLDKSSTYANVHVLGKHGLMIRVSRNIHAECLPKDIEGLHAFIHPSSEGYITI
jgi:hypothetical protein